MAGGVRRDEHAGHRPQRMVGRQRLLLEDVEAGAGDLAGPERRDQIVEPRRHAAPDVDEERGALHPLKARAVHEAFGGRRVRHREDHEVGQRQQRVQRVGAVELRARPGGASRRRASIPDHVHAERGGEPRRLGADAADARR